MTSPRLIMALDVPTAAEALELVDRFEGRCDFYKVGLELFTAAGPSLVASLRARRLDVFLDLKLHDIPNTVRQAARRAAAAWAARPCCSRSTARDRLIRLSWSRVCRS